MSITRSASRGLSRLARNPVQCLLRTCQTSSNSPTRPYSTSTREHQAAAIRPRNTQQFVPSWELQVRWRLVAGSRKQTEFTPARRRFSTSTVLSHNELVPPKPGEELHVTFIDKEGKEHTFEVAKGDNLLDIALEHDIEMEGACGGSCACSTCHVIVEDEELYNKMDEPDDDENDMLDLAFGLTETSRLGCQVKMRPELDGLRVKLPAMTRNLQASDFSKKNDRSD